MGERDIGTDPRTSGATLQSTAAAEAGMRIRCRARMIANAAEVRLKRTSDPLIAAELRALREDALELSGLANLASSLPRLGRWRLLLALLTG